MDSCPRAPLTAVDLRAFSKGGCHSRNSYKRSINTKMTIIVLLGLHACMISGRSPLGRSLAGGQQYLQGDGLSWTAFQLTSDLLLCRPSDFLSMQQLLLPSWFP